LLLWSRRRVLQSQIVAELLREIGLFLWSVFGYWQAYMTGGIVMALLGLYERLVRKTISFRTFLVAVFAFLLVAFFMAWRDQYRQRLGMEEKGCK
jgi:hypothetical protein